MNTPKFQTSIEKIESKNIFRIIDRVGNCVGKIIFIEEPGRLGKIYKISLLGTANGGDELDSVGLEGIYKSPEKITGLLYIMFKLFIDYISSIDTEEFTINICNPLLTLNSVYRNLYLKLLEGNIIDSGVITNDLIVMRHV